MDQYASTPTTATCPACHETEAVVLYDFTASESASHFVQIGAKPERHAALERHIEALWGGPTARVLRCTACWFGFADPYVAGDETFYTLAYERSGYPADKWEFDVTVEALLRLPAGERALMQLLEVGAGNGAFLERAVPALLSPSQVLATEFSEYGRDQIARLGVECRVADVRDSALDDQKGRFSAVCLFQVLEHLDGLDALFGRLSDLTTAQAHLFIAVPNDASTEFNELNIGLLDMPPNHIGRWTPAAFKAIGERTGWRITDRRTEPDRTLGKASQHTYYRYAYLRQNPHSVAARAERLVGGRLRRPVQLGIAGLYALASSPTLVKSLRTPGLGASQWVHFKKDEA